MSVNKEFNTSGISPTQFDSALEDAMAQYEKVIADLKDAVAKQAKAMVDDSSLTDK